MNNFRVVVALAAISTAPHPCTAESSATLTVVYDNYVYDDRCGSDWGFACVIAGYEETILFDTGGKGDLLRANLMLTAVHPADAKTIVISHNHRDHTGGLLPFLSEHRGVAVFLPEKTPEGFVGDDIVDALRESCEVLPLQDALAAFRVCRGAANG